jgi:hypothetical protein
VCDLLADGVALESVVGARVAPSRAFMRVLVGDGAMARVMATFGDGLVPVRIVAFNKTSEQNWGVPWHQDRVIAVAERHDHADFGAWTLKAGIWHCEPPTELLERLFFVRVHLDDCGPYDGAMKVAVGSHRLGRVAAADAAAAAARYPQELGLAQRGDVHVLNMLALHASTPSRSTRSRRVLRIDFGPRDLLPRPFRWSLAQDWDEIG